MDPPRLTGGLPPLVDPFRGDPSLASPSQVSLFQVSPFPNRPRQLNLLQGSLLQGNPLRGKPFLANQAQAKPQQERPDPAPQRERAEQAKPVGNRQSGLLRPLADSPARRLAQPPARLL